MRRRLGRRDAEAWRRMGFMHTTATNFVLMWDCRVPSLCLVSQGIPDGLHDYDQESQGHKARPLR